MREKRKIALLCGIKFSDTMNSYSPPKKSTPAVGGWTKEHYHDPIYLATIKNLSSTVRQRFCEYPQA